MLVFEFDAGAGGQTSADVLFESRLDVLGVLVGYQSAGNGRSGYRRNDGARAAAAEEVDVERGTSPAPFEDGVFLFSHQRGNAQGAAIGIFVHREGGVETFFAGRERLHSLVETGHSNASLGVNEVG